jgi:outer membrane protein
MKSKIGLLLSMAGIMGVVLLTYHYSFQPKTGYIIIQDVYNNFEFKKEMEKKFLTTKNARQKKLDSLEMGVKILATQLSKIPEKERSIPDIDKFTSMREDYLRKRQINEEDNNELSRQYDAQILSQLNQYIKDFGADNNYTYIFGNDGNGTLMFAKDKDNISKDVIVYVNKKYIGKNLK